MKIHFQAGGILNINITANCQIPLTRAANVILTELIKLIPSKNRPLPSSLSCL